MIKIQAIFSLFLLFSFVHPQNKSDFMIADSGETPYFAFDEVGKVHLIWANKQKKDRSAQYSIFDSTGNVIKQTRRISSSIYVVNPSLSINKDYVACIWGKRGGLDFTDFNTFIFGMILRDGLDYTEEIEIDDFFYAPKDAHRSTPGMVWHNDSILYSYWYGNGSQSNAFLGVDVYAQRMVFPPLIKSHAFNYVLDNPQIKVDEILPTVIKKMSGNGYLTIWVEKDSVSVLRIAGVSCDDSLKPNSSKITFINFDSVKFFASKPAVFHKQNGNIIIVWERDTTNFQANIFFQEFTEQGTPVGNVAKVNDMPASATSTTVADIDYDGRFIIVWEEWPNLIAQRYLSSGIKIGTNFKLNHTQTNGDYYPITQLRNSKIYTAWNRSDINGATSVWMNILDFDNPIVSVVKNKEYPTTYSLSQNYPNPFNPSTTISYQLPEDVMVTITMYDEIGREVRTLIQETKPAGSYEIKVDGEKLASGIYFYKMTAGSFVSSKKMLLLK